MNPKPLITDSPWFWVMLFSLVSIVVVATISGQYGKRQARLERQYQARERIADNAVGAAERREYSTPEDTLVPIWPLAAALCAIGVGAGGMLWRERRSLQSQAEP
jgi:hypothetical protein